MSLRDKLFCYDNLNDAFRDLRKYAGKSGRKVVGVDNVSIASFDRDLANRLRVLARELREGNFRFSSLRPVPFRKPNGKIRVICVPTVQDRIVQGAMLNWLSLGDRYHLDNGISYGFIRGQGVTKAVLKAKELRSEHPFVYRTDITSFFDTLPRAKLATATSSLVRHRSLHSLLLNAMSCEIQPQTGWRERRIKEAGIRPGMGVRQGMPLSPFFSNVILRSFDAEMLAAGVRVIRYADDLIFFADSQKECEQIHVLCAASLAKLDLAIPPIARDGKTRVYAPHEAADFLGVALVPTAEGRYRVEVTEKQQVELKREVLNYAEGPQLVARGMTFTKYGQSLDSTIAGYRNAYAYCDNADKIEALLEQWKAMALERLVKTWLGIPIHKLSADKRAFFGLPHTA